jgi:SAM-dependent methyltransferase
MLINDLSIDWREEWTARFDARDKPGDSSVWDERSDDHARRTDMSDYVRDFLAGLDLAPGETVFEMGSGAGTLAIPLAEAGHRVICGDFSRGMRDALKRKAEEAGVSDMITLFDMRWEDDWSAAGIAPKSVDVALASRSIMTRNLGEAIEKLESAARRQVAVTVSTRFGPRGERAIGNTLNGLPYLPDSVYATNILFDMERYPKLSYIDSYKKTGDGGRRLVRWAFLRWDAPE